MGCVNSLDDPELRWNSDHSIDSPLSFDTNGFNGSNGSARRRSQPPRSPSRTSSRSPHRSPVIRASNTAASFDHPGGPLPEAELSSLLLRHHSHNSMRCMASVVGSDRTRSLSSHRSGSTSPGLEAAAWCVASPSPSSRMMSADGFKPLRVSFADTAQAEAAVMPCSPHRNPLRAF